MHLFLQCRNNAICKCSKFFMVNVNFYCLLKCSHKPLHTFTVLTSQHYGKYFSTREAVRYVFGMFDSWMAQIRSAS